MASKKNFKRNEKQLNSKLSKNDLPFKEAKNIEDIICFPLPANDKYFKKTDKIFEAIDKRSILLIREIDDQDFLERPSGTNEAGKNKNNANQKFNSRRANSTETHNNTNRGFSSRRANSTESHNSANCGFSSRSIRTIESPDGAKCGFSGQSSRSIESPDGVKCGFSGRSVRSIESPDGAKCALKSARSTESPDGANCECSDRSTDSPISSPSLLSLSTSQIHTLNGLPESNIEK